MSKSIRVCAVALLVASYATPASAQNAINIFSEIRDAVPLRYFDPATTAAQPGAPNTLVIGFHETDPVRFRAALQDGNTIGTRLAADTLSVVVTAPSGHYIASITCHLSGRGAVDTPADARASANLVVNGQPIDLGSFGGAQFPSTGAAWSSSQTITFENQALTSVPVSLTAHLFAFAVNALASAEVDLTSATIVVALTPSTTTASAQN
jgi:hypothetical protein